MKTELSLIVAHHQKICGHLNDNNCTGNFILALCGRYSSPDVQRLLVQEIVHCHVSDEKGRVEAHEQIASIYEKARKQRNHVVLIAPAYDAQSTGMKMHEDEFSPYAELLMESDGSLHGSILNGNERIAITNIKLVGDDMCFWRSEPDEPVNDEFAIRHIQLFGQGTYGKLRKLKIAIVGCSGTGSPVVEQLARLGVGHLILIDPDHIEDKNVNRIINSSIYDAKSRAPKVYMLERAVNQMGLGTKTEVYHKDISNADVVQAVAGCDVIFGCMDSVDGRHLLNRIATFYLLPYFDIGIKLIADGRGGIEQVCGTVHYLQPGGSSLLSRRVYTQEQLYAANLKKTNPDAYQEQVKSKYIEGINEERPAVISVNMLFGAFAVNEFLARIHPYRDDHNSEYSTIRFSLSQGVYYKENESQPCQALLRHVGRGDVCPLLDMPQLSTEISK